MGVRDNFVYSKKDLMVGGVAAAIVVVMLGLGFGLTTGASLPGIAQLPGRLFSPSDVSKKLSHHFLMHFPIGMGSYDHHAKYQGVFQELL